MGLSHLAARHLFDLSCVLTRRFGGLRPRRLAHYLALHGYGTDGPSQHEFRWVATDFGCEFLTHPFFLIDRHIWAFGSYERPLQRYIGRRIRPGMTCLDVGANIGAIALHMARRVSPTGRVACFEPIPHVAGRLRKNIVRNGMQDIVDIYEVALGNQAGKHQMAIAPVSHTNQGMSSLVEFDHGELTESTTVACTTLDDFVREHALATIDVVKVDIQGAEALFLEGARQTLANYGPELILEIAPSSLHAAGMTSRDLLSLLSASGYRMFELSARGDLGDELLADRCGDSFAADNVICRQAV